MQLLYMVGLRLLPVCAYTLTDGAVWVRSYAPAAGPETAAGHAGNEPSAGPKTASGKQLGIRQADEDLVAAEARKVCCFGSTYMNRNMGSNIPQVV